MRLNLQSDYALRMLMHLASSPDRLVTIGEIADRPSLAFAARFGERPAWDRASVQ